MGRGLGPGDPPSPSPFQSFYIFHSLLIFSFPLFVLLYHFFSFSFDLFRSHFLPFFLSSLKFHLLPLTPLHYILPLLRLAPSLSSFSFLPVSVPSLLLPWFNVNSPALSFTLFLSFFSFLVLFLILSFPCLSFLPLSVCLFSFSSPFHPPFYFLSIFLSPSLNISLSFYET